MQKQRRRRLKGRKLFLMRGRKSIGEISKRELLLIGATLYWCEGFKKDTRLGFANSDPSMIQPFLHWLYTIGRLQKHEIRLRAGVNISYKEKVAEIERKWSEITGIPLSQFQTPFFSTGEVEKGLSIRGEYLGVLRVRANGQRRLFLTIQGMLEGLKNMI